MFTIEDALLLFGASGTDVAMTTQSPQSRLAIPSAINQGCAAEHAPKWNDKSFAAIQSVMVIQDSGIFPPLPEVNCCNTLGVAVVGSLFLLVSFFQSTCILWVKGTGSDFRTNTRIYDYYCCHIWQLRLLHDEALLLIICTSAVTGLQHDAAERPPCPKPHPSLRNHGHSLRHHSRGAFPGFA